MPNVSPLFDAQMREHAANALKHIALFRHVSQRLLSDLVSKYGLEHVPSPPNKLALSPATGLAVLIVLEGAVRTLSATPQTFDAGTYVRYTGNLILVTPGTEFSAVGPDTVRVFVLDNDQITRLPRVIVNALDLQQLNELNASL